ncbi:MAG: AAA family ATPase [Proteobacteria bacterium]|nr:AAA family ATPase [Pseudomonadota bacterium]
MPKLPDEYNVNLLDNLKRLFLPLLTLDEIHKYRRWKQFLKGFYDTYEDEVRIFVTGSPRLDVCRRGGDCLMGRYFLFRMHPFSVAETIRTKLLRSEISPQSIPLDADWQALWEHGGVPEPFVRRDRRFSLRWQKLRNVQLLREDIRDPLLFQPRRSFPS